MRDYLEAIRRCLLRGDQGEARRLLDHAYRFALPGQVRRPLADLARGGRGAPPAAAMRQIETLQDLMLDDAGDLAPSNDAQLELRLHPEPWSRPVSLTVARAAWYAGERHDDAAAVFGR